MNVEVSICAVRTVRSLSALRCGLNEGDCGCSQENIDPRWAALVDIMEKDK